MNLDLERRAWTRYAQLACRAEERNRPADARHFWRVADLSCPHDTALGAYARESAVLAEVNHAGQ